MASASPDQPPGIAEAASPLAALSAFQASGVASFDALRRLARRSSTAAVDVSERDAAHAALAWVDRCVAVHHRVLEDVLLPELIESMAGSDPVCLRELAAAAIAGHHAMERPWRIVRPGCAALSNGSPEALDAGAVLALVDACRANFLRADRELIPLAGRLLDDAALTRLRKCLETRDRAFGTPVA